MGMDFDIRYREILKILDLKNSINAQILEVGALPPACLSWYLDKKINYLGINKNFEDPEYKIQKIDFFNSNFSDKQFDYTISTDTLEHVRQQDRARFVNELIRVTKKICIIGVPNPEVSPYEETLVELLSVSKKGKEYVKFFKEHEEYGIPTRGEITRYLKGYNYEIQQNFALKYWVPILFSDVHRVRADTEKLEGLHASPAYRSLYIVKL